MENKNTIYNDDVERIVNDLERQEAIEAFHQKRKVNRQKKMLDKAIVLCGIAILFQVCGLFGLIVEWISLPVFAVSMACSAFCFGRWFENGKIYGWY